MASVRRFFLQAHALGKQWTLGRHIHNLQYHGMSNKLLLNQSIHTINRHYSAADGEVKEPEAPIINIGDVEKIVVNKRIVLLDVRNPDELKDEGFLPSAVNVPVDSLENALNMSDILFKVKYGFPKPLPSDHVVVYCKLGRRSTTAGKILLKHNFKNVQNYKGSWTEWKESHPEDVVCRQG